eukprot:941552-Pelagomonas_calceolata.AAC.3
MGSRPLGMTSFAPPSLCCCCTCCSSAWGGGTHSTKGSTPSGSCSAGGGGGAELVEGGWLGIIGGVNGFFWPHGTQYLRANKRLRSSCGRHENTQNRMTCKGIQA